MTTLQLIDNKIPQLQLEDTVNKALQLIADFKCTHLPVVDKDKYSEELSFLKWNQTG